MVQIDSNGIGWDCARRLTFRVLPRGRVDGSYTVCQAFCRDGEFVDRLVIEKLGGLGDTEKWSFT